MHKAKVDVIEDGKAVISWGVAPGERIVTSGYYRLQPGTPVEIRNGERRNPIAGKRSSAKPASIEVE